MKTDKRSKIFTFFKYIDSFRQPIGLRSKGWPVHTTACGGFATLIIFVLALMITSDLIYGLIYHQNITSRSETVYIENPEPEIINTTSFPFAFGLRDPNYGFNNSIFMVTMQYTSQIRIDGIIVRKTTIINIKPCDISDFPGLEDDFQRLGIKRFLCPSNFSSSLLGTFNSEEFAYIKMNASKCTNGTNPYITCAPKDVIDKYIAKNDKIRFNLFLGNYVINTEDYNQPMKRFIDEQNWIISAGKFEIVCDLFLTQSTMMTEDSITGYGQQVRKSALTYAYEKDPQIFIPGDLSNDQYLSVYLRRSVYSTIYYRKFANISDILSKIGGFWNFLYLMMGLFVITYNKLHFRTMLAQNLFEFDINQENQFNKELDEYKKIKNTNKIQERPLLQKIKDVQDASMKFFQLKRDRSKLRVGPKEIFKGFLCKQDQKAVDKKKLLQRAWSKISEETDVINIIKKLHEVDKIKRIIMNSSQLSIFNFTPSPLITTKDDKNKKLISKEGPKKFSDYLEHYEQYAELKKNMDPISKLLLNELDKEVLNVFEGIDEIISYGYVIVKNDGEYQLFRPHAIGETIFLDNEENNEERKSNNDSPLDIIDSFRKTQKALTLNRIYKEAKKKTQKNLRSTNDINSIAIEFTTENNLYNQLYSTFSDNNKTPLPGQKVSFRAQKSC